MVAERGRCTGSEQRTAQGKKSSEGGGEERTSDPLALRQVSGEAFLTLRRQTRHAPKSVLVIVTAFVDLQFLNAEESLCTANERPKTRDLKSALSWIQFFVAPCGVV